MKPTKKIVISLISTFVLALFLLQKAIGGGDFVVFLHASEKLFQGLNIYAPPFIDGLPYFYSPFFALMLYPFCFNYVLGCFVWLIFSTYCLYRIVVISMKNLPVLLFSGKDLLLLSLIVLLLTIRFLLYNYGMVQMTIFLLWALLEGVQLAQHKKHIQSALLLALAINIKILPVVILPYLIYRGYFKTLTLTVLFSLVFLVVPAFFIGWNANLGLLKSWWLAINPENASFVLDAMERGPHGLNALMISLLMDAPYELPYRRNLFDLDLETVKLILYSVTFALIAFTVYFLRTKPFSHRISNFHSYWELSYICLLIPLIFPHQQKYAFFFIFPAVYYISYFLILQLKLKSISKSRLQTGFVFLLLSFILSTLSTDGVIGREYNNITQYYKFITYGTLLLIIPLALFKPQYLENE